MIRCVSNSVRFGGRRRCCKHRRRDTTEFSVEERTPPCHQGNLYACLFSTFYSYGRQTLSKKGANVDISDRNRETALHKAAVLDMPTSLKQGLVLFYDLRHRIMPSTGTYQSWRTYRSEGPLWTNGFAFGSDSRKKKIVKVSQCFSPKLNTEMQSRTDLDWFTS